MLPTSSFSVHIKGGIVCSDMFIRCLVKLSRKPHLSGLLYSSGRSKKVTLCLLHGCSLFRSFSDLIKYLPHIFRGNVSYSSNSSAAGPCQSEWPWHCWEVSGGIFLWFPHPLLWTRSGFNMDSLPGLRELGRILICLVNLPRATTSKMAGQVLLDPL